MRYLVSCFICATLGCGSIDPDPPVDANGQAIPIPASGERWLTVEAISPQDGSIPAVPEVVVTLSEYIEPSALIDFDVISLTSGGIRAAGSTRWDASTRTLHWRPYGALIDGLDYTLHINANRLTSVVGSPLFPPSRTKWRVDHRLENPPVPPTAEVRWADVEPILAQFCWSCHQDPNWQLNPLTRTSMISKKSDQVDRFIVMPFSAARSYLLHKVLPDYPMIMWETQPPSWSHVPPLSQEDVARIELWILQGAR